jgi:hypothetical protein
MSADNPVLRAALSYQRQSWNVVSVRHRTKRPLDKAWQTRRLSEDDIRREFSQRRNVGVLLGPASGNLVDVDLDVPEAAAVAARLLPATASFGHGDEVGHLLYVVKGELVTRRFASDRTNLLELRGEGAQTVFPPSTHESGEPIRWIDECEPHQIDAPELMRLVALVAAATVFARAWPARGARHDASLALAGGLLTGMARGDAEQTFRAILEAAGDDEAESRIADFCSTAERVAAGEPIQAWGKAGESIGKDVVNRARGWLGKAPSAPREVLEGRLPEIAVTDRQMRSVSDDIVSVLHETNDPPRLLVRGGQLVRIREDENGQPFIELLDESRLLGIANRVVDFVAIGKQGQGRAANAPHQVLRDVLVRGYWPFPPLVGLTQCPVVRPDGGIVEAPGYDPATRLVYVAQGRLVIEAVSHEPRADELTGAVQQIDDLLFDFPFDGAASRANMIALLLEPLLRPAIDGPVPLALIDATSFGTGKSLLCEILALLATGHPAAMTTAPGSEDEMRKRITAMLLAGAEFVFIDNIVGQLRSESLAAAITATSWKTGAEWRVSSCHVMTDEDASWAAPGFALEQLARSTRSSFVVVAPFIKAAALERVLAVLAAEVELLVVTRWRADEIAVGVSDLEVWDAVKARADSELLLCANLHAKYFRGDDRCLIGSANVSQRALGWSANNNVEILATPQLGAAVFREFEVYLASRSVVADDSIAAAMREAAEALAHSRTEYRPPANELLNEPSTADGETPRNAAMWLPKLRHPEHLRLAYVGDVDSLSTTSLEAALADLSALALPPQVPESVFLGVVGSQILQFPLISAVDRFLVEPRRFGAVAAFLAQRVRDLDGGKIDGSMAWQTLMRWLCYFLPSRYAVTVPNYSEVMQRAGQSA